MCNILAYFLHARTVAARQWKSGVFVGVRAATVAVQRRGKHDSPRIEAVFSTWSVPRSYLEDNWRYSAVEGSAVEC
jgi:hypothetical protein